METYCKADCEKCSFKDKCNGCLSTCGSPLGGKCIAAEYIKTGGIDEYKKFKEKLLDETNEILSSLGIPEADGFLSLSVNSSTLNTPCRTAKRSNC